MQLQPRSRATLLLLLEQVSAPRAHLQLPSAQVLLAFTDCETPVVQERSLERICILSHLLASCSTLEVRAGHPPARPSPRPCAPARLRLRGACKTRLGTALGAGQPLR